MRITEKLLAITEAKDEIDACRLLVTKCFPGASSEKYPIDVVALAASAGVPLTAKSTNGFDGVFEWDAEGYEEITINSNLGRNRSRFTIAHELGHWMIHKTLYATEGGHRFRGQASTDPSVQEEEKLANMLAAELLMPLKTIYKAFNIAEINLKTIRKLASDLHVSQTAMLRRVADVSGVTIVHLNIMPNRFAFPDSTAFVDDALLLCPGKPMLFDRDHTSLLRKRKFNEIRLPKCRMGIITSLGRIFADFEVFSSSKPVPNKDLLAVGVSFRPIISRCE